jgi:hypothetical protein
MKSKRRHWEAGSVRKAMAGSLTLAGSVTGEHGQKVARYAAARAIIGGLASPECEGVVNSGLLKMSEGIECFVFLSSSPRITATVSSP